MKKIIIYTALLLFLFPACNMAQNYGTAGVSFSMLNRNRTMRVGETFPADYGFVGKGMLSAGVDYIYPLNSWLSAEAGLNYSYENFDKVAYKSGSAGKLEYTKNDIHLINIPVGFRITFLKFGFIDSGILVDLLNEPGIGSYFGGGVHFQSEYGLGLMAGPYIKAHSILPFNFNLNTDRIIDMGLKIGLTYSIDYFVKDKR